MQHSLTEIISIFQKISTFGKESILEYTEKVNILGIF
jgi:hypothetical protein